MPPAPSTSCLCCCASDRAAATFRSWKRWWILPDIQKYTHTPCRTQMLTVLFFTTALPADSGLLWAKWRWDCPVSGGATQCSVPHFQLVTVWSRLQGYRGPEWYPVPFTALWGEQWEHKGGELPSPHPNTPSILPQGHLKRQLTILHFSRFLQLSLNLIWSESRILTRKGRRLKVSESHDEKLFWSSFLKQVSLLKKTSPVP